MNGYSIYQHGIIKRNARRRGCLEGLKQDPPKNDFVNKNSIKYKTLHPIETLCNILNPLPRIFGNTSHTLPPIRIYNPMHLYLTFSLIGSIYCCTKQKYEILKPNNEVLNILHDKAKIILSRVT